MRKYLFLDIDGTLFSTKLGGIPGSASEALKKAREKGHKVFLCTGRTLAEVASYLNYDVDGFVLGAGAQVYAEGQLILDQPLPAEDVKRIKQLIASFDMGYSLEGSAGAYCNAKGYDRLGWYLSGGSTDPIKQKEGNERSCTYTEEHGNEDDDAIYKVCAFGPVWNPVYLQLEKLLPEPYILTKAMDLEGERFCIGEVTDPRSTKGVGVQAVLHYYGGKKEDAYGFGDSENDIPMFEACGTSVAMGNATPGTKEAADYITDDILQDGLAKAMIYYHLV